MLQAFGILDFPVETQKMLLTPQREVAVELVITRDDGNPESFMGYRVQHDDSRGPFKVRTAPAHDVLGPPCGSFMAVCSIARSAAAFEPRSYAGRAQIPPSSGYR